MQLHTMFTTRLNKVLLSLTLVATIVALGAYAVLAWNESKYVSDRMATIVVTGEGTVMAVPDLGTFSFSVIAQAETAEAAQADAAERNNDIVAYLAEAGVEEVDVKTTGYNLYPQYRYEERACLPGGFCPPGERVLAGYEVQQRVEVLVRDTAEAGSLISGVGQRGADNISSLQFTIDDDMVYVDEARAIAIADAKSRAENLAASLGLRVVRIVEYSETGSVPPMYAYSMERSAMAMDMAESVPEMPVGENEIRRSVTIVYEVR